MALPRKTTRNCQKGHARNIFLFGLQILVGFFFLGSTASAQSPNPATIQQVGNTWTLENDVLSVVISFDQGSVEMNSFFSIEAGKEYLTASAPKHLFYYAYGSSNLYSDDSGWTLGAPVIRDITGFSRTWGKQLEIPLSRTIPEAVTVRMIFEIYDGRAGLRYQTFIRNNAAVNKTISASDVIALNFPNNAHVLHMCPIFKWHKTTGSLAPNDSLNAVCAYNSGDGWALQPEVNWKTAILLPETGSTTGGRTAFTHINAWSGISNVQVATNPESLQLVLFPGEEFEYIAVNLTAFKGDAMDGRMAMQEHFQKRFKYNNVTSVFFTNDWDWIGKRTDAYYRNTVIPKAKSAGLDMVMVDDLWNTTQDTTTPKSSFTTNLSSLTDFILSQGMRFGLWFSMTGGGHNQGRDLADPAQIEVKRLQVENVLIPNYHVSHQMIDLTEFWPNNSITTYSHPSDNVYRKNVRIRNYLNGVVSGHPNFVGKLTNEVDIYPTRGDRMNGLLHICDNGFIVSNGGQNEYAPGQAAPMKIAFHSFGYMPMESVYLGGAPSKEMGLNYVLMLGRFVKFNTDPAGWDLDGIPVLAKFNRWRKSTRVRAMTEEGARPLYAGVPIGNSSFDPQQGPYAWMYTNPEKSRGLLIATAAGRAAPDTFILPVRWVDPAKTYLLADVSMRPDGMDYGFVGRFTGAQLRSPGFTVNLASSSSKGKAYWLEEDRGAAWQVIYADEVITGYSETVAAGELTVQVQGAPNSLGTLIMYDRSSNTASHVNVNIEATGSGQVTFSAPTLYAPEGLIATAVESGVTLAWDAVPFAANYNVKRSTALGGPFTVVGANVEGLSFADSDLSPAIVYYYVVSAVNDAAEGPDSVPLTLSNSNMNKLSGTVIGTTGAWNGGTVNTREKVYDGLLSTFFDAPTGNGAWAGVDLGSGNEKRITRIRYSPRNSSTNLMGRMVGGQFQGSATADFSDPVTLYTVVATPTFNTYTTVMIDNNTPFRYLRYLSPNGGFCNVSEVEFYSGPPSTPAGVTVSMLDGTATLNWAVSPYTYGYRIQRAMESGPYVTVGENVTTLSFQDAGLSAAATYYYVVSAFNEAGENVAVPVTASDLYSQWLQQNGRTPGAPGTGFNEASDTSVPNGVLYGAPGGVVVTPGADDFSLTVDFRNDPAVSALLQSSTDLVTWTSLIWAVGANQQGVMPGFVRYEAQDPMVPGQIKKFYRLQLNR
jgi:hypothetical protein